MDRSKKSIGRLLSIRTNYFAIGCLFSFRENSFSRIQNRFLVRKGTSRTFQSGNLIVFNSEDYFSQAKRIEIPASNSISKKYFNKEEYSIITKDENLKNILFNGSNLRASTLCLRHFVCFNLESALREIVSVEVL